jgi:hypothetical protein
MSARAGTIGVRHRYPVKRQTRRLTLIGERIRRRRRERARRAHALRESGARAPYVPGSEHTHMLPPARGF